MSNFWFFEIRNQIYCYEFGEPKVSFFFSRAKISFGGFQQKIDWMNEKVIFFFPETKKKTTLRSNRWMTIELFQEKKKHKKIKNTNNSGKKAFFGPFVRFHVKLVHTLRNILVKPGKITKKWPFIFFWVFVFFFRFAEKKTTFRILNEWMTNHLFRGKKKRYLWVGTP